MIIIYNESEPTMLTIQMVKTPTNNVTNYTVINNIIYHIPRAERTRGTSRLIYLWGKGQLTFYSHRSVLSDSFKFTKIKKYTDLQVTTIVTR